MARTGNNQRSANRVAVDVGATGTKPASKGAVLVLFVSVLAAVWAVAMMTTPGRVAYYFFFLYTEYYMGVICLVATSITIMVGLVATDRLVLSIRQRVMLQSTHRTISVLAVAALVIHVWTKVAEKHIGLIDVFVPFLNEGKRLYVGLGTVSAWVMIMVMATGIARARFIGRGRPWMWRGIHAVSYLMWPLALMHGLSAGRPAKPWVIVSYVVCVLLVLVGMAVRLSVSLNRNKDFSSSAGLNVKPVGSLVPTASLAMKAPRKRDREPEPEVLGPVAVVDAFQPVRPKPSQALPLLAEEAVPSPPPRRGGFAEEMASARGFDDEIDFDEPGLRGRRYPGAETSSRLRRPDLGETSSRLRRPDLGETSSRLRRPGPGETSSRLRRPDLEDTSTRLRRPDLEDTSTRLRRPDLEDTSSRLRRAELDNSSTRARRSAVDDTRSFRTEVDEPVPRQRQYEDDPAPRGRGTGPMPMYEGASGGRRRAAPDDFEELPRQRSRYDDEPGGRRGARFEPEDTPQGRRERGMDTGRHSRTGFIGVTDGQADEPTLVDTGSRRARQIDGEPTRSMARRAGRSQPDEDLTDDDYFSQLRGEAN